MGLATRQTVVPLWHYTCPQCGVGDEEIGAHAPSHAIYCEVCLEDGQQVRLRRWQVQDVAASSSPAGKGPG